MPHIAVVKALQKKHPHLQLLYIGSKNGPEREKTKEWGWDYVAIPVGKWRRYWNWRNMTDMVKVTLGVLKSLWIIWRFRPDVLFSKGGYASVPVIMAAWMLRVPIVIHDSDAKPGLTTRLTARFTHKICLGFKEAQHYFPKEKIVYTGIPLRPELWKADAQRGLKKTKFNRKKPILLVVGGSLGSRGINEAVWDVLPQLLEQSQIVHILGKGKAKHPSTSIPKMPGYRWFENVGLELLDFYAMSDLIVTRAGANTLAEIHALQKPSILIPLGKKVSHGDQIENARALKEKGVCEVIEDDHLTGELLLETIRSLLSNPERLRQMAERIDFKFNREATQKIAEILSVSSDRSKK